MNKKSLWKETGLHTCPQCLTEKGVEEIVFNNQGNPGWCKPCKTKNSREYMRMYRDKHPELSTKNAQRHKLKRYNITPEEFTLRVMEQGGVCGICGTVPSALFVDHDHTTGKVRGLLCQKCNSGIGFLGDSLEGLEKAVNYLKNNPKEIM